MKTSLDCMECNIKQLIKVSKFVSASDEQQAIASKKIFKMLSEVSFDISNPEIMGETWKIIIDVYPEYAQKFQALYKEIERRAAA